MACLPSPVFIGHQYGSVLWGSLLGVCPLFPFDIQRASVTYLVLSGDWENEIYHIREPICPPVVRGCYILVCPSARGLFAGPLVKRDRGYTGGLSLLLGKERVRFSLMPVRELRSAYKESLPLFVSILSTQIYVNVNKLVIGSFLGMLEVSIYDMADKVLLLMKLPASMIAQAVFPKISREQNIRFINHVMFLSVGIALLFYISMFFGSDWLVYLLAGEHIEEASVIMRLLGISAILTSINGFLGGNRLVPLGYSSVYMRVMVGNCLFFLTAMGLLWLTGSITMYTVTVMAVGVEVFCFVSLVYRNWRLGL